MWPKKVNLTKLSRRVSHALRHAPEQYGLSITHDGWVDVNALVVALDTTSALITEIVSTDDKGRYQLIGDRIRAVQGHSTKSVNREFIAVSPPEYLFHGTAANNLDSIMCFGINSGSRHYVHLSADAKTAASVGARHGDPVILTINATQMWLAGYRFYCAENGVWLTKEVPAHHITHINHIHPRVHNDP